MTTQATNFANECRMAFIAHCHTLATINPAQTRNRNANRRRRADLIRYIDDVLDTYLEWQALEPFERDLTA